MTRTIVIGAVAALCCLSACKKETFQSSSAPLPVMKSNVLGSFTVSGVQPSTAVTYGVVSISGSNFSTAPGMYAVKFNGVQGVINKVTASHMVVTVPAGAASGTVTITAGTQTDTVGSLTIKTLQSTGAISLAAEIYAMATAKNSDIIYATDGMSIFKWLPDNTYTTIFKRPHGYYVIRSLEIDAEGNLYVAWDDHSNLQLTSTGIFKITPDGIRSNITNGGIGYADGFVPNALFKNITDITFDPLGQNLYVFDYGNYKLRKINKSGLVSTIRSGNFGSYNDFAVDSLGNSYIYLRYQLFKISAQGAAIAIAGRDGVAGTTDGLGSQALFNVATSGNVELDLPNNLLYIGNYYYNTVVNPIRVVNSIGYVSSFTPAVAPKLVHFDNANNRLYVADKSRVIRYEYK